METRTNLPPETPRRKLAFHYDSQGRRTEKTVLTLNTNAQWETASTHHFLYDGWNLLSEISYRPSDMQTNTRWFVWGLDLSGTLQGAGGIGGLLAQISGGTTAPASLFFPAYDANGNITEYFSTNGTIAARFEYDPFGNTIAQTGPQADNLPFRFSTKYTDDESGLVYYGYRFYSPELGRWPNRDPIEEKGGINLQIFVSNDPLNKQDKLGLVALVDDATIIAVIAAVAACAAADAWLKSPSGQQAIQSIASAATSLVDAIADGLTKADEKCTRCTRRTQGCKPCIPIVGSIAFRVDLPPSPPHGLIATPHSHMHVMLQSPPTAGCVCNWHEVLKDPLPGIWLPPISNAGGGGVAP